jgi:hypothetical protein
LIEQDQWNNTVRATVYTKAGQQQHTWYIRTCLHVESLNWSLSCFLCFLLLLV